MMGTRWPKEEYEQYEPKELRQQASGSKARPTHQQPFKEGSHFNLSARPLLAVLSALPPRKVIIHGERGEVVTRPLVERLCAGSIPVAHPNINKRGYRDRPAFHHAIGYRFSRRTVTNHRCQHS